MQASLSVIIITKNESSHIAECLKSVSWADEIIVLDSGSSDDTVEICKRFTKHVYETDWPGFGPQKQRALDKVSGNWVLSIDADEQITDELKQEIISAMETSDNAGYEIPRLSSYCGRQIKHGGWWPDYVLRLFQTEMGYFTDSLVHERVIVNNKISRLQSPIIHDSFTSAEEVLNKINSYSSLNARMLADKNTSTSLTKAILRAAWTFFRTYILKASFLDGTQGLMLAISNAEGTYYKYVKLLLLNKNKQPLRK